MQIERLTHLQPGDLTALIAESEHQGQTFVRRLADEWAGGANRFDRTGEALFAVRVGGAIVAVGGLNVDPYAGDPGIGRVRHLYVLTAHQRRGLGARLVAAIVEAARGPFHTLRLSTFNPDAARLYERLGFRPRADANRSTHVMVSTRLRVIAPQLLVDDLEAAIAYYRDRLGFSLNFRYEGFYAAVGRDGVLVHLKCAPKTQSDRVHRREHEHLDAYVAVTGVEALYAELQSRGARIIKPLGARPWGHTDFYVEDADGYILCFSEETS